MSEKAPAITSTTTAPPAVRAEPRLLQRKCACGTHTKGGGECDRCRGNRNTLQRSSPDPRFEARHSDHGSRNSDLESRSPFEAPPIVHEVLRSAGQPLDA